MKLIHNSVEDKLWPVNWAKFGYPHWGIYVISASLEGPSKIGVSRFLRARLGALKTDNWTDVDIRAYGYCVDSLSARAVEEKAHVILTEENKKIRGEWFDVSVLKAVEVINFAADTLSIELRTDLPILRRAKINWRPRGRLPLWCRD